MEYGHGKCVQASICIETRKAASRIAASLRHPRGTPIRIPTAITEIIVVTILNYRNTPGGVRLWFVVGLDFNGIGDDVFKAPIGYLLDLL
jgi:hypothetical protein